VLSTASVWTMVGLSFLMAGAGPRNSSVIGSPVTTAPSSKAYSPASYQGWVHVQIKNAQADKLGESLQEDETELKFPEIFFNKPQAAQCMIVPFEDGVEIRYFSARLGEMAQYSGKQKLVAFGTMHPMMIVDKTREIAEFPLTREDYLHHLNTEGAAITGVSQAMDGKLQRIVIAYTPGKNSRSGPKEGGMEIVWVDPRTKFIQKVQTTLEHSQLMIYSYLKDGPRDIYDFGVPRDTTVLDGRPTVEAKAVLDRLDRRAEQDFGNYVAVLTQIDHRKSWGSRKKAVQIYARDGKKAAYLTFTLREEEYPDSPMIGLQGWPLPKIDEVLRRAEKTIPLFYYVTNGSKAWSGSMISAPKTKEKIREAELPMKYNPLRINYCLSNEIWKGRESLHLYDFGPRTDTLQNKAHPNAVGVRLREGDFSPKAKLPARTEKIYWIDPNRDDMPLETTVREEKFIPGSDTAATTVEFHFRYLNYGQLPDGRWYPTHWENQLSRKSTHGRTDGFSLEFHLQVFPNMELDPTWYGSRATALKIEAFKLKSTGPLKKK
jgi:hypothetical protein